MPPLSPLDTLPDELLIHIFSFCTVKELNEWAKVCRRWNRIMRDDILWREAFRHYWGFEPWCRVDRSSWKMEYITRIKQLHLWKGKEPQRGVYRVAAEYGQLLQTHVDFDSGKVAMTSNTNFISGHIESHSKLTNRTVLYYANVLKKSPVTCIALNTALQRLAIGFQDGSFDILKSIPTTSMDVERDSCKGIGRGAIKKLFWVKDTLIAADKAGNLQIGGSTPYHADTREMSSYDLLDESRIIYGTASGKVVVACQNREHRDVQTFDHAVTHVLYVVPLNIAAAFCTFHVPEVKFIDLDSMAVKTVFLDSPPTFVFPMRVSEADSFAVAFADQTNTLQMLIVSGDELDTLRVRIVQLPFIKNIAVLTLSDVWLDRDVLAVVTPKTLFILDCINGRLLRKEHLGPRVLAPTPAHASEQPTQIMQLEAGRVVLLHYGVIVQILNFGIPLVRLGQARSSDKHVAAMRKGIRNVINDDIADYQETRDREEYLAARRDRYNVGGLNEQELLEYAMMISMADERTGNHNLEIDEDEDTQMELALRRSLQDRQTGHHA